MTVIGYVIVWSLIATAMLISCLLLIGCIDKHEKIMHDSENEKY